MSLVYTLFVLLNQIIIVSILVNSSTNALKMKMIAIHSPELQILPNKSTLFEKLEFFNNISMSRAHNIRKHLTTNDMKMGLYRIQSTMFVTQLVIGEGSATHYPYLYLDTGSELTWVQCAGCNPCFQYKYQNFRYQISPSFQRISGNSPLCNPRMPNADGPCRFRMSYGIAPPHPWIAGLLGRENFRFVTSLSNNSEVHPGLLFGCVQQTENLKMDEVNGGPENIISGIFGLAATSISMLFQLEHQTRGRFSYCIPPFLTNAGPIKSTIDFGNDARISGDATRQVQTISMYSGYHYSLFATGISFNGKHLQFDHSIFLVDPKHRPRGFMIDSGTPFTILANSAYVPLRDAMIKFFRDKYGWTPKPPPINELDLCYSPYPNYDKRDYPTVTLHFLSSGKGGGTVDMVLRKEQLFLPLIDHQGKDDGFCLMVKGGNDPGPSILGSYQQVNFRFLYDVHNRQLSFVPDNCAKP